MKKVLIVLGTVLILVIGWFLFFKDTDTKIASTNADIEQETTFNPVKLLLQPDSDTINNQDVDTNVSSRASGSSATARAEGGGTRLTAVRQQGRLLFQESYTSKRYNGRRTVRENQQSIIKGGGSSYRLMEFSRGIGALLAMYEATGDKQYMEEAADLSERIIKTAKKGKNIANNPKHFKDDFYGWANQNPNFEKRKSGGEHLQEIPLFESYLFRYLAKIPYMIKTSPVLKSDTKLASKADELFGFVKTNGWEKWYQRGEKKKQGCYPYLFRQRTHMTSHWAMVALYLRELSNNSEDKAAYSRFLSLFDNQLKDNFHVTNDGAYVWNMTWDSAWPYDTECNSAPKSSIVQDVSHGNHVVTYIVEAHELSGSVWKDIDVQRLANTVKYVLYNADRNLFNDDLAGKFVANKADGVQMSDGFVKLARYDEQLMNLFERVNEGHSKNSKFSLDEPQFVAELTLAKKTFAEK